MTVSIPYVFENNSIADATEVNANFDAVVNGFADYLPLVGGTLSGPLVLPNSDPTLNNQAARKKYVDESIAAISVTPADGSITAAKLATDAVETAKLKDANVTAAKLAADAVETAKIKDANVTAVKVAAEAWTSYTPTWGGLTLGNSTVAASSMKRGELVDFKVRLSAGSTVSHTGAVTVTLPYAAKDTDWQVAGRWTSSSGNVYWLCGIPTSTTVLRLYTGQIATTDLRAISTDGNTPTTLASGHVLVVSGSYEAAIA